MNNIKRFDVKLELINTLTIYDLKAGLNKMLVSLHLQTKFTC